MSLTFEALKNLNDRKPVAVEVPEWGGTIYLRPLSAGDRIEWENEYLLVEANAATSPFALLAYSLCDEDGNPLGPIAEGLEILRTKNPEVVMRLYRKTLKLNLIGKAAEDQAKN